MPAQDAERYEVTCPHCRKRFSAAAIGGPGRRGFKCPHCRLFVPFGRAGGQELVERRSPG